MKELPTMDLLIKQLSAIVILSITLSSFAYSADITRTLRNNAQDNNEPENFLEIGVGAGAFIGSSITKQNGKDSNLGLTLSASYNWHNFFIDVFAETGEPVVIGYNAYNNDVWSFDVVLGTTGTGVSDNTDNRFIGLNKRESSAMLGGRLTGYLGDSILQISLRHDVSGSSKGTLASALAGRNWQYRNWNFHGLISVSVSDEKFNDYYLGVTAQESAVTGLEVYDGKTSMAFSSSIGVTYPISENWIYRATLYASAGTGLNDSPLFAKKRNFRTGVNTSISYVF